MIKRSLTLMSILFFGLTGFLYAGRVAASPAEQDINAANEAIAQVNAWRMQEGLWPLRVNATLSQMALGQANFILPFAETISNEADYHLDAERRTPSQRAARPPFNWPASGLNVQVGENAALGSVKFAMNFWQNSAIHRRAALSNVYREVGVAAVKHRFGFFFIMNFGARPGVLPTLINPVGDTLYLTNDCFCPPKTVPQTTMIRIFDADGAAIDDPHPWRQSVPIPPNARMPLTILYSNGLSQSISRIDTQRDLVLLPSDSSLLSPGAPPNSKPVVVAIAPTPTATDIDSFSGGEAVTVRGASSITPTVTPFPINTRIAFQPTASPLPSPIAVRTQLPTIEPSTPMPTARLPPTPSGKADLELIYTDRAFILYNAAKAPLNLTDLAMVYTGGRIGMQAWLSVALFPVDKFPVASCLSAQIPSAASLPANTCRFIRSAITLSPQRQFWVGGTFKVQRGDTLLATCFTSDGRCEVVLNK